MVVLVCRGSRRRLIEYRSDDTSEEPKSEPSLEKVSNAQTLEPDSVMDQKMKLNDV